MGRGAMPAQAQLEETTLQEGQGGHPPQGVLQLAQACAAAAAGAAAMACSPSRQPSVPVGLQTNSSSRSRSSCRPNSSRPPLSKHAMVRHGCYSSRAAACGLVC